MARVLRCCVRFSRITNNMARTAQTPVERVAAFALYSRILVFIMQTFFNYLMPDHEAGVFNPPNVERVHRLDWWTKVLFDGLRRWDSIYFLHISEHGYTYENTLAFCPLFPMMVRLLANSLFLPLQYFVNYPNVLLITAVVLNIYLFVKSAKVMYHLSEKVLGDETLAMKAAQLYCINPASVFFSAAYSEALFALVTFSGMLQTEMNNGIKASLLFGLSGIVRSNGLVNLGFVMYWKCMESVRLITSTLKMEFTDIKSRLVSVFSMAFIIVCPTVLYVVLCILPFATYQYYAYTVFCNKQASYKDLPNHILNYGNNQLYKMPHTGLSPWCHQMVPLSYTYVQANHWDVGFLRYYQWKQIPNFVLAAPMLALSMAAVLHYFQHNLKRIVIHKGMDFYKKYDEEKTESTKESGFYSAQGFVYIVHLLGLFTVAAFFMHVQVATRFICCSSPVIYWFVATITTPKDQLRIKTNQYDIFKKAQAVSSENGVPKPKKSAIDVDIIDWDKTNFASKAIFIYFHLYFFVGTAAFSNFLPWT